MERDLLRFSLTRDDAAVLVAYEAKGGRAGMRARAHASVERRGWAGWSSAGGAIVTTSLCLAMAFTASVAGAETIAGQGSSAGTVEHPNGVAVDQGNGDLYVADENRRISKFDAEGHFLLAWGFGVADDVSAELQTCGPEATPPTIKCFAPIISDGQAGAIEPDAVTVDQSSGDVYVADSSRHRVSKFTPGGEFLFMAGKNVNATPGTLTPNLCTAADLEVPGTVCGPGGNGSGPGEFFASPTAIAVDPSSHDLYVADGARIVVLDSTGGYLSEAAIPGGRSVGGIALAGTDIYTLQRAVNEEQTVSFASFAEGDKFTLGNLPAVCSASATSPIEYKAEDLERSVREALVSKCGGENIANPTLPFLTIPFRGELAAQDLPQMTCTKNSGGGVCSVSTVRDGAPGRIEKLEASGSPPNSLTPIQALDETGHPSALTVDSGGDLYVGDAANPYRFLRFNPAGELTSLFGAGKAIGEPGAGGFHGDALAVDEIHSALYAASGRSAAESAVQRFALPGEGPLAEDLHAEDLLPTTATLATTLNPEGHATEYHFEYVTRQAYEEQGGFEGPATEETPEALLSGSGFAAETVSAVVEGLLPETEYRLRLVAENENGETTIEAPLVTPPAVAVDSQWTEEVTASSALFKAELDPLAAPAGWRLEYGTTESYGNTTELEQLGSGIGPVTVARRITGLAADTLYHYRFAAEDKRDGVTYLVHGPDQTVLTALGVLGFELVDGRAWEQVSPLRKGGGRIVPPSLGFAEADAGGGGLTYLSLGPVSEAQSSRIPELAQSLARHGPEGWSSKDLGLPHETSGPAGAGSEFRLFSPDLDRAAVEPRGLRATGPGPLSEEASEWTPYLRENLTPPRWRPLVTGKEPFADVCPGTHFGGEEEEQLHSGRRPIRILGGSPDLGAVIIRSQAPLTCDAEGTAGALYKWSEGTLQLISRLPEDEGGTVAGGTEAPTPGSTGFLAGTADDTVSSDGRYVYWSSPENTITALYMRDTTKGETVRLDTPEEHSIGGQDKPIFQGASVDGRHVFFTDTRHLTPDAGEIGADLYECELVEASGKDECLLHDLTPETAAREAAGVQGMLAGVSENGESLYFVANGALGVGAEPGDCTVPPSADTSCNLYHAQREGGSWSVRFIVALGGGESRDWGVAGAGQDPSAGKMVAAASPSGRYLAFMSERQLTGYDNRDAAGGGADQEVFRYDSVAEDLACVSCNPSGARPRGELREPKTFQAPSDPLEGGLWGGRRLAASLPDPQIPETNYTAYYRPRSMLDDGRVLFNAFDSLVSADSNGVSDAYEYEPWGIGSCDATAIGPALAQALRGGGCVALLSSGTSDRESAVIDSSASGEDVFILTASELSVLDEDPAYDIYDARVGGVAAGREEVVECLGEACQPQATPPPTPTPATAAAVGDGNLAPSPPASRCRKHSHKAGRKGSHKGRGKRSHKARRKGKERCAKGSRHKRHHRGHHRRAHR